MKKLNYLALSMLIVISLCVFFPVNAVSQESARLAVTESAVCLDVIDLECIGADTNFPANVGKLYCITKITGATGASKVTHVWYYGQTERARISLDIRSSSWRTYSSKRIQAHETGDWHIDVLGPENESLKVIPFAIGP